MIPTATALDLVDVIGDRFRAAIYLAALAGLRAGEILGLRRCDVDLLHATVSVNQQAQEISGRRIVVPHAKSDAGRRTVHLIPEAVEALGYHLEHFAEPGPQGTIFTGPGGLPMRRADLSEAWTAARKRVGAPENLHFHDLRHHAGTFRARKPDTTLKEVMAFLGHSTPRAALIYQHATDERAREAADWMGSQLGQVERKPLAPVVELECEERVNGPAYRKRRKSRKTA
jgi:integrase